MVTDKLPRIVLIEDNPTDVMLLRLALESQGDRYAFQVLEDGEQALKFVREHAANSAEPEPCVVVLDLHLPKVDGITIVKAIKNEPALDHIKVVLLTGLASDREKMELEGLNLRLCQSKPSGWEGFLKLAEEIRAICNEHVLTANA